MPNHRRTRALFLGVSRTTRGIFVVKGKGASRELIRDSHGVKPPNRVPCVFRLNGENILYHPMIPEREFNIKVLINKMEWIDSTGENFNLGGFVLEIDEKPIQFETLFTATYRTDERSGVVTLDLPGA